MIQKFALNTIVILAILFAVFKVYNDFIKPTEKKEEIQADQVLPPSFIEFYQQFHRDTNFQLAHIRFPLSGLPAHASEEIKANGTYFWQKQEWKFQKALPSNHPGFNQKFVLGGEQLIFETITDKRTGYKIERRFAQNENSWYLIYYADMN